MPVTDREFFDTASQSGSGESWSNIANLEYGNSSTDEATCSMGDSDTISNILRLTGLESAFSIPTGSSLDELEIRFQVQKSGFFESFVTMDMTARLVGGSSKVTSAYNNTYDTYSLSGDINYWGISGNSRTFLEQLLDGSKYLLLTQGKDDSSPAVGHIRNVTARITYTEPDISPAAQLMSIL